VLAVQERLTAWTPVPERGSLLGELVALLRIEALPVTLPAAVGAKVTLKSVFCPADRVRGRVGPLILKPVPVTESWGMVTLPVPVLVRITGSVLLLPTTTLPKLTLAGLATSVVARPTARRSRFAQSLPRFPVTVRG
jgi:hypothetical protein